MDLRQLEYFLAVVEHGGVHRAAALHVAQPSLSQSLRRLERDLQADLFHRVGRGLVLAPAGEALIGPARQMLALPRAGLRPADRARDGRVQHRVPRRRSVRRPRRDLVRDPHPRQARTRELFLLPAQLPAREARAAGLVTRVTPAESFPADLAALTAQLAASAPRAVRAMKANLRDADRMPVADYLDVESERMVATFHTDDAREAARAFLERREPVFTGR
ncbi:LysR family transcriptional regulator [Pseudonocardia adelaidensis]|uniref:HTH lysR-type domain-containing protein n=1 Tax=Pseudonocardia adelaidensis TaxID=648754 RepID=A0ABP9NBX3_9PSEU